MVQCVLLQHAASSGIAQLVEHWSPKPGVVGSSPATPATFFQDFEMESFSVFENR